MHQHTRDCSSRVERADAIVYVTPEYNNGYPAGIKNALDYLHAEWQDKPVGFGSYGGVSAGTRAVAQLKQVVTVLGMVPVAESVAIPFVAQFIDGEGQVRANEFMEQALVAPLDEVVRLDSALRPLRDREQPAA